eukprot:12954362-Ditylum_brightwellii.AAC.1
MGVKAAANCDTYWMICHAARPQLGSYSIPRIGKEPTCKLAYDGVIQHSLPLQPMHIVGLINVPLCILGKGKPVQCVPFACHCHTNVRSKIEETQQ